MKVGSLFSGIGGLELGLEWAGMEVAWQVEYDSYCQKVLAERWPNVKRYGDIYEVKGTELERVDIICGGFPCQPFSHAGKRKGTADSRWLWPEFYRIVCEVKPRWVIIENVPGLLSIDAGRVFAGILRDLANAGYNAEWRIVSAADVGARHLRKRVFIVAHADNTGIGTPGSGTDGNGAQKDEGRRELAQHGVSGRGEMAHAEEAIGDRCGGTRSGREGLTDGSIFNDAILVYLRARNTGNGGIWEYDPADVPDTEHPATTRQRGHGGEIYADTKTEGFNDCCESRRPDSPGMGIVADGLPGAVDYGHQARVGHKIPERVNRLKCLGNAVVPQVAEYVGLCIMEAER